MEEQVWKVVAAVAAVAGAAALRPLARKAWVAITDGEPPTEPAGGASWKRAAAWTLVSGAAIGVGRIMGQRAAAEAWKQARGDYPPGLRGGAET